MKPNKQKKRIIEEILIVAAMLIVGFASVFAISINYPSIYHGLSYLPSKIFHKDFNQTIDWLRGK